MGILNKYCEEEEEKGEEENTQEEGVKRTEEQHQERKTAEVKTSGLWKCNMNINRKGPTIAI